MRISRLLFGAVTLGGLIATPILIAAPASRGYPLERKGVITQGFNVPWSADSSKLHTGIDIDARAGTEVYAIRSGTVEAQGWLGRGTIQRRGRQVTVDWGYYLVIRNEVGSINGYLHINPYRTYVRSARIRAGDRIGVVFENVVPHLHLNECYQVAGCQHGAWPSSTFSRNMGALTKYYVRPSL